MIENLDSFKEGHCPGNTVEYNDWTLQFVSENYEELCM